MLAHAPLDRANIPIPQRVPTTAMIRLPVQRGIQKHTFITFWYINDIKMNLSKNAVKVSINTKEITMDKYIRYSQYFSMN